MRLYGKFSKFIVIAVFLGFIVWAIREGKFSPLWSNAQTLFLGKREPKLTFKDYKFKEIIRKDVAQKVLATGTVSLKTGAEVKIGARISGQLDNLMVKIGDIVKAGDTIATIEHEDLLARVAQFSADLKEEAVRLAKVKQEGPLEINRLKASLEERNVQIILAEKMLLRNQSLKNNGIVSEATVDQTDERLMVLNAQIKLAKEEIKLANARSQNDILLQEVKVEKALANIREQKTQLSHDVHGSTVCVEPLDDLEMTILTRDVQWCCSIVVTLIDLKKVEVTAYVDETDIGKIKEKQKANFTVDAFPKIFFDAVIREIRPKAVIKDNVVNYEVMLDISKKNIALLRPEMTANIIVTTGTHHNVLVIPRGAVKRSGKKSFAVIKENANISEKAIELGYDRESLAELIEDLWEKKFLIKTKNKKRGRRRR